MGKSIIGSIVAKNVKTFVEKRLVELANVVVESLVDQGVLDEYTAIRVMGSIRERLDKINGENDYEPTQPNP